MSRFGEELLRRALSAVNPPAPPEPVLAPSAAPRFPEDAVALAAALCRRFEGLHLQPYLCPAGIPTIGYGATRYEDGRAVSLTDPHITRALAEEMLLRDLRRERLPAVRRLCPGVERQGQLAALLDFSFNLGVGALAGSTLRRRINTGDWASVPAELRRWVRADGRVLRGLQARREAEIALLD